MAQVSIIKKSELEGAMRLDAEYYQPAYLQWAKHIENIGYSEIRQLGEVAYGTTPTGGAFEESGIPFIRSQNFALLSVDTPSLPYCTYEFHRQNLKSGVKPGDILLAAVGTTIGQVAVAPSDLTEANINQNIARVRITSNDYLPVYVAVFLSTHWGQFQIRRLVTGNAQQYLNSHQICQLRIPKIPVEMQTQSESFLQQARQKQKDSETFYLQAEQLLLDEIDFKGLDLSHQLYYTVPYRKAREVGRLDAEHFQPKYKLLIEYLAKTGKTDLLGNRVTQPIRRGLQPTYVEDGEVIVVNSQHLGRYLLNIDATERTDEIFWQNNKRCQLQRNDVLFYSTGAYIGRTNAWLEDQKAISSNHVTIIRPDNTCNSLYLAVYLNSPLGLLQAERWASGSGQREIYPTDIAHFVVYLPPMAVQRRIADLVTQSWEARQKARQLLEEAKRKVEDLVEGRGIKGVGS